MRPSVQPSKRWQIRIIEQDNDPKPKNKPTAELLKTRTKVLQSRSQSPDLNLIKMLSSDESLKVKTWDYDEGLKNTTVSGYCSGSPTYWNIDAFSDIILQLCKVTMGLLRTNI